MTPNCVDTWYIHTAVYYRLQNSSNQPEGVATAAGMAENFASNNKYIGGAISPGGMVPKLGIHIKHTSYYI